MAALEASSGTNRGRSEKAGVGFLAKRVAWTWRFNFYHFRPIVAIDGCFLNVVPIGIIDFPRENAFICSNHDGYYNHVIYLRQEPCAEERHGRTKHMILLNG